MHSTWIRDKQGAKKKEHAQLYSYNSAIGGYVAWGSPPYFTGYSKSSLSVEMKKYSKMEESMFTQVIQTLTQAFTSVSSLNLQSTVSNVTNVKTTQEAIAQSIKMLQEIEVTLAKQGSSAQQDERASAEAMIAARKEHKNA